MNSALVMFGIDAAVKLGGKINDIIVDSTAERPLLLPAGELFGSVALSEAIEYFDEHPELTQSGAPYHGLSNPDRLEAYRMLLHVEARAGGSGGVSADAVEIVKGLDAFRQYQKGFGANSPVRRVLGTILEIGIDYLVAHPETIGSKSSERRILQAFVEGLDETDFAEGSSGEIVGEVLVAMLTTLQANTALVADDDRTQALIGGVTKSLLADIKAAGSPAKMLAREHLVKRIGSSIVRGGARAFSNNIDLFLPKDNNAKKLVGSTLTQLLTGIEGKENLFTNESLELLFGSALRAVGENAEVLADNTILQQLIARTLTAMTDTAGKKVFPAEVVSAVLSEALAIAGENIETLITPDRPEKQLLASATRAVAQSLSGTLAGDGTVKDLLSRKQLVSLMGLVFGEVAKHPEQLLGSIDDGDRKAALAQIIGSVARALGANPTRYVNGEGFVLLVKVALRTAAKNAHELLDLETPNPRDNVLFQVIQQFVAAVDSGGDIASIVNREVFIDIARRVLPLVSANIAGLTDAPQAVQDAVAVALKLANDALAGRINGENLADVIIKILGEVLWNELDLSEAGAVLRSATQALKAA